MRIRKVDADRPKSMSERLRELREVEHADARDYAGRPAAEPDPNQIDLPLEASN